jgi:hypothetical protein
LKISFNSGLKRLVGRIKINVGLKIQWKHNHYLYSKIVYNAKLMQRKAQRANGRGKDVN